MCHVCLKHAGGNSRWYLNVESFNDSNADKEFISEYHINYSDINIVKAKEQGREHVEKIAKHRLGQVVPLEDAVKILKLVERAGGENCMIAAFCPCRQTRGGITLEPFCIGWGVSKDAQIKRGYVENLPLELRKKVVYPLSADQAGELITKWEIWYSTVHTVYLMGNPYIGRLCNCEWPYCHPLKQRLKYNLPDAFLKAHYVAAVNYNRCTGCGNCEKRCQFGAIHVNHETRRATVNPFNCFGCGVCRSTCAGRAIQLVDREKIPSVKDFW